MRGWLVGKVSERQERAGLRGERVGGKKGLARWLAETEYEAGKEWLTEGVDGKQEGVGWVVKRLRKR